MIFEYKVKARHRLGWKEFKLYADTDIEEFFNRNSIDYVRNMTDTVEHRLLKEIDKLVDTNEDINREFSQYKYESKKEIERLNNIINKIEEHFVFLKMNSTGGNKEFFEDILDFIKALKELKGSDKE